MELAPGEKDQHKGLFIDGNRCTEIKRNCLLSFGYNSCACQCSDH